MKAILEVAADDQRSAGARAPAPLPDTNAPSNYPPRPLRYIASESNLEISCAG